MAPVDTSNEDTKPNESGSSDVRELQRQAQLRSDLEVVLENTEYWATSGAILGAFSRLTNDAEGAQAYEVIAVALRALVSKDPTAQHIVRAWNARMRGCDPTQDAISLVDLFGEVERAVYLYANADSLLGPGKRAEVVQQLGIYIEAQLTKKATSRQQQNGAARLPSLLELEELLSKHTRRRARNGFTTMGIVARIVHQSSLLGARAEDDLQMTLSRVDAVMTRARKAERKLRESAAIP